MVARPLLDRARAAGKPVWCDVHDYDGTAAFHRPWVEAADVLLLNEDGMADPVPFMRARVAAGTSGLLLATLAGEGLWAAVEAGHRQAAACLRSPGLAPDA